MKLYAGQLVRDDSVPWLRRVPPVGIEWMQNFSTPGELGSQNDNDGQCLFAMPDDSVTLNRHLYTLLASGVPDLDAVPSGSERAKFIANLRITPAPAQGSTIGEILLHGLINGDPHGADRGRCMQPDRDNWTLHGPSGATVTKPFDIDDAESDNFKELLQTQYRALRADATAGRVPDDLPAKALGALDMKYARDDSEMWAVPTDLRGSATKKHPTTQVPDDFNRANAHGFGTGTVIVEGFATDCGVVSNQAAAKGTGPFTGASWRYDAPLSSADHWAQANFVTFSEFGLVAVYARMDTGVAGAHSGYTFQYLNGFGFLGCEIYVWVAGVESLISSSVTDTPGTNDLIKLAITSSGLVGSRAGVTKIAMTDTTLSGGLRVGGRLLRNDGSLLGSAVMDNLLGDDGFTSQNRAYYFRQQ